eukprot:40292_1
MSSVPLNELNTSNVAYKNLSGDELSSVHENYNEHEIKIAKISEDVMSSLIILKVTNKFDQLTKLDQIGLILMCILVYFVQFSLFTVLMVSTFSNWFHVFINNIIASENLPDYNNDQETTFSIDNIYINGTLVNWHNVTIQYTNPNNSNPQTQLTPGLLFAQICSLIALVIFLLSEVRSISVLSILSKTHKEFHKHKVLINCVTIINYIMVMFGYMASISQSMLDILPLEIYMLSMFAVLPLAIKHLSILYIFLGVTFVMTLALIIVGKVQTHGRNMMVSSEVVIT